MAESIIETSAATFEVDVLNSPLPVMVDFWAPWCGPCREIEPLVERIAKEYAGRLRVVRYNIDDSKDTWKTFDLRGIPALRFFRDGREVGRPRRTPSSLWRALDAALASDSDAGESSHLSFGGDAQRKAQCIARLQKAIKAGQLAKGSPDSPVEAMSLDGSTLPSVHASGGPSVLGRPQRYVDVLGVPSVLGELQDSLFEMLPSDEGRDARFAVEWVAAIPVGYDLGHVPGAYAHWLINNAQWGLAAHLPEIPAGDGDVVEILNAVHVLWQAMLDLHRLQDAGQQGPNLTKWQTLNTRAIELAASLKGGEAQQTQRFIHAMRLTMTPQLTVDALLELIGELMGLTADRFTATWWTETERALIACRRDEFMKRIAVLGERPSDPTGLDAWWRHASSINNQLSAEFDAAHPALVTRREAMGEAGRRLQSDAVAAHIGFLLTRLQGGAEAPIDPPPTSSS